MGKRVVVIGVSWSTSRRLSDNVDTLVLYDVDVDPPVVSTEPVSPREPASDVAYTSASADDINNIIEAIEGIIRDERKAGGKPL